MSVRKLYGIIVGRGRVSPAYFLDSMTLDEVDAYLEGWEEERHERWEMVRRIAHSVFQCQSTRQISPEDVISFPWDDQDGDTQAPTAEEVMRAREEARRIQEQMKAK